MTFFLVSYCSNTAASSAIMASSAWSPHWPTCQTRPSTRISPVPPVTDLCDGYARNPRKETSRGRQVIDPPAPAQYGAVDKVSLRSALPTKKDALWRHPACFIIRFRFNAVADKRQWSSAASKPRRKTRAKLCSRFCAENEPSHQTCRSFSASR